MASLPIPQDYGVPYIANIDSSNQLAIPVEQYILSGGIYVPISTANPLPTVDAGTVMEDFGATVASRPDAALVPIGFVWMAVTTQEAWQSDGTNWIYV